MQQEAAEHNSSAASCIREESYLKQVLIDVFLEKIGAGGVACLRRFIYLAVSYGFEALDTSRQSRITLPEFPDRIASKPASNSL